MSSECIQVLHVDDEPDLANLASDVIERDHPEITIEVETDPRECLERLQPTPDPIDCIVSDYDMPHLDGLEMLEVVRDEYPDFPFILFTGRGSEEIAAEAIAKGVDDYMQKEMGVDQFSVLAKRIRQNVRQARTEQALRNSEEKFRALVEQNLVGIYLIKNGEFTYVNPHLAETFGYDQEAIIGMAPEELVAEQDRDLVAENLRRRLAGETDTIRYEFTGLRKNDEEFTAVVQGRTIQLNDHLAVAGVLLDVEGF